LVVEVEETEGEEMIPGGMSDLTIPEYDPHDPMCPSMDESESEYCSLCHCHLIAKVREDMLAKCIAAVEAWALENPHEHPSPNRIITALRALLEDKPQ
jgi:hypothetical protein